MSGARGSPGQYHHFAFRCESLAHLHKLRAQIKAAGVKITHVVDHGLCHSAYFQDPDGVGLEITATARPYLRDEYDLSLLKRTPAPEEDMFHPQHASYKAKASLSPVLKSSL